MSEKNVVLLIPADIALFRSNPRLSFVVSWNPSIVRADGLSACLQKSEIPIYCSVMRFVARPRFVSESCGRPRIQPVLEDEDRVLGGTEAVPGSWPWHAGIYTNQLYPAHICSGVLISERHVLTAVHCLTYVWKDRRFMRRNQISSLRIMYGMFLQMLSKIPKTRVVQKKSNTFREQTAMRGGRRGRQKHTN